jgi:L-histidine N-alpha-methyltransferase
MNARRLASRAGKVAVTAIAAAAASYDHTRRLAEMAGQPSILAALLPLSVDGLVLVGTAAIGDRESWPGWSDCGAGDAQAPWALSFASDTGSFTVPSTGVRGTPTDKSLIIIDVTFKSEDLDRIAAHLVVSGEIDARYSYVGEAAAAAWDRFVAWQERETAPNGVHATRSLLRDAYDELTNPLRGPVRVVDLGPGNGVPVRGVLERLRASGRLERYVAVDMSVEMLAIAEANLRAWLGPDAPLEFRCRDFAVDPLADLRGPATLVLLAGGTLLNFADPVAVLRHVRDVADVVVCEVRVDTIANRALFLVHEPGQGNDIPRRYRAMLDSLGIPRDRYEPERGFDEMTRQRYLRIRLTGPVTVAERLILPAGSRVHLWRYHHHTPDELTAMLGMAGYTSLTNRLSADGEFLLFAGCKA